MYEKCYINKVALPKVNGVNCRPQFQVSVYVMVFSSTKYIKTCVKLEVHNPAKRRRNKPRLYLIGYRLSATLPSGGDRPL